MDLNELIFRDDAAEPLGAELETADDHIADEQTHDPRAAAKIGLAAIGSFALGLSHFLGHVTKSF